jgi:hypothetical protein
MKLRVLLIVMCAVLLVVPAALAETTATMSVSGDVETNTTFQSRKVENPGSDDFTENAWTNDGRTKITFEGMLEGDTGWFASANGQALLKTNGNAEVDDAWVQMGTEGFSVKVGRYELEGLFSKGEDVYIAEAPAQPDRYEGNYWRGRHGDALGNIALIVGGLELGFVLGSGSTTESVVTGVDEAGDLVTADFTFDVNSYAFRPVYKFSTDTLTLKIGGEYGTTMPQEDKFFIGAVVTDNKYQQNRMGGAIDLSGTFGSVEAGVASAYGQITGKTVQDVDWADLTQMAVFGWAKIAVGEANTLGLGLGYARAEVEDGPNDDKIETYVSFIQQLPVEGLKIKYAASYAGANLETGAGDINNSGFGARVRLNYDF